MTKAAGKTQAGGRIGWRKIGWRRIGWGGAAALLLLPPAAMQATREVDWTPLDFVFAAAMLGAAGGAIELAVRTSGDRAYRAAAGIAVAAAFVLIWVDAAVGIVGDEDDPANLLYLGVVAVALGGAVVARLRPAGMARAMLATAAAQVLAAAAVLAIGRYEAAVGTLVYLVPWLVAAWLFGRARAPA